MHNLKPSKTMLKNPDANNDMPVHVQAHSQRSPSGWGRQNDHEPRYCSPQMSGSGDARDLCLLVRDL